ncbi:hypothetical protein [Virgisporangium ochraceum]|uniref:Uncharacterized protein n=1 Tax=Virgisporangium ochraceum TaxID=65505 RepID=A0A8J4E907_9ACTN|nr:hypothetical protein [Virgisporangium ochraceum]GIJ66700.1 hypothetical protein Voc01_016170 [Virgisporangium ochraceum]
MTAAVDRWAALPGPRKLLTAARHLLQERRSGPGVTVRVDLALGRLRAALGRAGDDLLDLLTRTGGPVEDVRARRGAARPDSRPVRWIRSPGTYEHHSPLMMFVRAR